MIHRSAERPTRNAAIVSAGPCRDNPQGRSFGSAAARVAVLAALALITFLFLGTDLRFRPVAGELATNLAFDAGLAGWGHGAAGVGLTEADGRPAVILERRPGGPVPFVFRQMAAPHRFTHLRFAADLRTVGVVRGDQRLQRAGAALWSFGADGRRLHYWPGEIALLSGDTGWRRYERILPVHEAAAIMQVYLYVGGRSGHLWARNLTVTPLAEIPGAATARTGLLALWMLVGLWAAAPMLAQAARRPGVLLVLLVGAGIALGTLTPQPRLSQILDSLAVDLRAVVFPVDDAPPVPAQPPEAAEQARTGSDAAPATADPRTAKHRPAPDTRSAGGSAKHGSDSVATTRESRPGGLALPLPRLDSSDRAHLLAFSLLGFLVGWVYRADAPLAVITFTLLVAAIGEILQFFTPSRESELSDLLCNLLGAGGGLVLASLARRLRPPPARRRPA